MGEDDAVIEPLGHAIFLFRSLASGPLYVAAAFVGVMLALMRRKRADDATTPSFFEWLRRAQLVFFVEGVGAFLLATGLALAVFAFRRAAGQR